MGVRVMLFSAAGESASWLVDFTEHLYVSAELIVATLSFFKVSWAVCDPASYSAFPLAATKSSESPSSMFSPFESIQVTSAAAPRPEITHDIICCFPVVMLASPDGVIAKGRY